MTWSKYNITLHRLTQDKIELVRNWRNDPKVSQYMVYKEYITPEMQLKWFNKINNDSNYYFIAEYKNEEIGLVNLKDIKKDKQCAESGIFVYDDKYLNSLVAFYISFCLFDFAFEELKLNYISGQIVSSNKRAIRFNKAIGVEILTENSESNSILPTIIYKENYLRQRDKYIRILTNTI